MSGLIHLFDYLDPADRITSLCHPAIQQALDAAAGGVLVIEPGEYLIDPAGCGPLEPRDGTEIHMYGAKLRVLPNADRAYDAIRIQGREDVTIRGGAIVGDAPDHFGVDGEWGMCIAVRGSRRVLLDGVTLLSAWGDGIYITRDGEDQAEDVDIVGCRIRACRRTGIAMVSGRRVSIRDCRIMAIAGKPTESGIGLEQNYDADTFESITIEGCHIENCGGRGIYVTPHQGNRAHGVSVRGNRILSCGGNGIEAWHGGYIIAGNDVASVDGSGICLKGAISSLITGNRVRGTGLYGIYAGSVRTNNIANNDIELSGRTGILIERARHNLVHDNLMSECVTAEPKAYHSAGIQLRNNGEESAGNSIRGNAVCGGNGNFGICIREDVRGTAVAGNMLDAGSVQPYQDCGVDTVLMESP